MNPTPEQLSILVAEVRGYEKGLHGSIPVYRHPDKLGYLYVDEIPNVTSDWNACIEAVRELVVTEDDWAELCHQLIRFKSPMSYKKLEIVQQCFSKSPYDIMLAVMKVKGKV